MSKIFGRLMATVVLVLSPCAMAAPTTSDGNVIVIDLHKPSFAGLLSAINQPYVSVKVCEPGTQHCQIVNNIQLDTGSVGLRIFSSQLSKLNLPAEKNQDGSSIAECIDFGGFHSYWGAVKNADVILGNEKAPSLPVQIVDSTYPSMPSTCKNADKTRNTDGINGILGVNGAETDCLQAGGTCPAQMYLSCEGGKCSDISTTIVTDFQITNPVMKFPKDNNGIAISFPKVAVSGASSLSGTLTFGIGTESNNQPPAEESSSLVKLPCDSDGGFEVAINGNHYDAVIDTGTSTWFFPSPLNYTTCTDPKLAPLLCPDKPINSVVDVLGADGKTIDTLSITVDNAQTQLATGNVALPDIGISGSNEISSMFLAGLPFFYGRTVYIGFSGKSSSIGTDRYYAYSNN